MSTTPIADDYTFHAVSNNRVWLLDTVGWRLLPAAGAGLGTAIVFYAFAAITASARRRSSIATSLAAIVAVGVGIVGFAITATPVIAAEHLRAHTVAIRTASIRQQLRRHPGAISVMPASLTDTPAEEPCVCSG